MGVEQSKNVDRSKGVDQLTKILFPDRAADNRLPFLKSFVPGTEVSASSSKQAVPAKKGVDEAKLDQALAKLRKQTNGKYRGHGKCAVTVRLQLNAAGIPVQGAGRAGNYGPNLKAVGYQELATYNKGDMPASNHSRSNDYPPGYVPKKGDMVIFRGVPYSKHTKGHAAIYDEVTGQFISDFQQGPKIFVANTYREHPNFTIYRALPDQQQLAVN